MPQTVAIIGAGRVGRALGLRLREMGWTIGVVLTQSPASARHAVRIIGAGRAHATLTRQVMDADLVLIATPDRSISSVAAQLAKMGGEEWRGKVVLHTNGARDRRVLAALERRGAATGSLHPLQSFSDRAAPQLEGCIFAVEGSREALRAARRIVRSLGGTAVLVVGEHKPAYHAAGTLVSGHVLGVVEAATRVLMQIGFTRRQAVRALLPLLRQTLKNFERFGPGSAWTGPVARGDYATVSRHVAALKRLPREFGEAYAVLARLSAILLGGESQGLSPELLRVLNGAH
jgi:predicted short-subunit dehydrogenase-like oxidoreductase (DUF2520 family)